MFFSLCGLRLTERIDFRSTPFLDLQNPTSLGEFPPSEPVRLRRSFDTIERIDRWAAPAPPGAISGAWAAREAPRRRKSRCHGAQTRARGASLAPPTTPSAHWAHPGASMRRQDSPIARRRARSRAAGHPKMAARAASAARAMARAGVAEAIKVLPTPNATQGRNSRSPISPPVPPGGALVRRCVVTARIATANRRRV